MHIGLFDYHLPEQLIAQHPPAQRGDSRLLVLPAVQGELLHTQFAALAQQLRAGDLLIFNDTRVIPARWFGHKVSGGKVEVLVERLLAGQQLLVHLRASNSPKPGTELLMEGEVRCRVLGREGGLFHLECLEAEPVVSLLQQHGHMPLPPYIQRADAEVDSERYQTVYARESGAVAAPTAGLHFTDEQLQQLQDQGVDTAFLTLHVGAGTFQPIRAEAIEDHHMHREWIEVSAQVCDQVAACRARGGRVVAVGTTVVRSLESAARGGELQPYCGDTDIFIYPGFEFKVVQGLVTNFHLPKSSLLLLVSAFAGYRRIREAYTQAIVQAYRFFSYGDAMLLWHNPEAPKEVLPHE